ncbi:hypothetical protein A2924_04290 [Candidatus Giovannonibacteria bacterium RIFCSPLOWO2_01_FULL_44_16]|uniref:Uncharacterized protein n=1 Tax=Candidatus Giovannonibacteria bacterium RIFCSPLOWO2_01_FULL_44_16 TaxID=1798348 RepID=A0A1F5X265_9BACT|nr:MAG: hypothetical protein A2924_04290 [Candidatus Giovannonibacteria bacterium RIFCSPLOWO2_01_FULL_44_16]
MYNDMQGLINGVIFYFEPGDDEITKHTFDFLAGKIERPTSIVRLADETVSIRFTVEREMELLREYLQNLAGAYPPLEDLIRKIGQNVLPQIPKEQLN